jgi:multidrug efflux pump subunit AcrA (membrane-fusion protein)
VAVSANDDVKRFSAFLRQKEADEQQARDDDQARIRAETAAADAAKALAAAKQTKADAAARVREIRRGHHSQEQLARAEAEYRRALAAEVELESGTRPTWAPAVPEPETGPTESLSGEGSVLSEVQQSL